MCTHTHTCTGRGVRGLRVRLFSITPPCWQPHSISPSSEDFISLSGEEGLLCQELTMAEDIPTRHINNLGNHPSVVPLGVHGRTHHFL